MVKLVFAQYDVTDPQSDSPRVWVLLWQALYNPQWTLGPDKATIRRCLGLFEAVDKIVVRTKTDGDLSERARLNPAGGELVLEGAEFELLQDAWNKFYPGLPRSLAREVWRVENFLATAETVPRV